MNFQLVDMENVVMSDDHNEIQLAPENIVGRPQVPPLEEIVNAFDIATVATRDQPRENVSVLLENLRRDRSLQITNLLNFGHPTSAVSEPVAYDDFYMNAPPMLVQERTVYRERTYRSIGISTPTVAQNDFENSKIALVGTDEETEESTAQCTICLTNKKCVVSSPCGHIVSCVSCAKQLQPKCPMCRARINQLVKVFF